MCATGNAEKFRIAKMAFADVGVELEQAVLDIDEIQGENADLIVRDKVAKAFSILKEPVIVTDDFWNIPALNGFPGPYMKSMNHWFEPSDFLELMSAKKDRSVIIEQNLAYTDGGEIVIFRKQIPGVFAKSARGKTGPPIMHVVELEGDNGLTIAELFDKGLAERQGADRDAWRDAAEWFARKENLL